MRGKQWRFWSVWPEQNSDDPDHTAQNDKLLAQSWLYSYFALIQWFAYLQGIIFTHTQEKSQKLFQESIP